MGDRRLEITVGVILTVCVGLYVAAFVLMTNGEFFAGSLVAMILWIAISVMMSSLPSWAEEEDRDE